MQFFFFPRMIPNMHVLSLAQFFFCPAPCALFIVRRPWHNVVCSVIRLGLGKLLVNQLQVVKRTNTPLD